MEEEQQNQNVYMEKNLQTIAPFHSDKLSIEAELLVLYLKGDASHWASCHLLLKTDSTTYARLEQNHFFGNFPENRLETLEISFNETLPVFFKIELRQEKLAILPPPKSGRTEDTLAAFSGKAPEDLFSEESWYVLQVWQEHPLDPSIGGGNIKVGYRTIWSPPENEIDWLKRRGNVSRTVVEAFIENGLPVHFDREIEAFKLVLTVGTWEYPCYVYPGDPKSTLSVEVEFPFPIPEKVKPEISALLDQINAEIILGCFELEVQTILYRNSIQIDRVLLNHNFILETLKVGVTMMHHNTPYILHIIEV